MSGDEIVISGMSGLFPDCKNVDEFQKKLLNMEDCVVGKTSWVTGNVKFPDKNGKLLNIYDFDIQSFGIHKKLAENMDPVMRLQLRSAYECVADAGINPRQLRGKKIAVFSGTGSTETELTADYNPNEATLLGNAKAMVANRISFLLGINGPSTTLFSMNTSGATAIEKCCNCIRNGEVEAAIVASGNAPIHPFASVHLSQLGILSPDGLTRSFDEKADGFARSGAIVAFFIQKARDAKRIYAEIKSVQSLNGPAYERLSMLYPTCDFQIEVMKSTLKKCGLSGKDISFVEADGLGIKEADENEIKAIDQVFNEGRKTPLLIGSVRSNTGNCDNANTLISIVKVITMMETGNIPPNLHYKNPSKRMSEIHGGRIKVVTEPTPWTGEYVAVNTTSVGGGFSTVILKSYNKKSANKQEPDDNVPRLTMVSGANEDAVNSLLDYMESKPVNCEVFQMISDIFEEENKTHLFRGYTLLPPTGTVTTKYREIEFVTGLDREIWYVFSGMGSQWVGMGKTLMGLPVFAESVRKCDAVLKPYKIDIINIITSDDPTMFDSIVHSFVGIITIQIGLVDVLTQLGIKPDFIIGHSVGELGCAYADGCLTAEQAVLNALFRGYASVETELPVGLMAAVGLGYEAVKPLCPPDIDVACHNSSESSTISGPAESMKGFISTLQAKGIFAKGVPTSNIAYHSRYIAPAGKKLLEYLRKIIPDPKTRSPKWISTSVPQQEWKTPKCELSSAEYFTNNLLSPVLFEESSKIIPSNAITIEIAPHGLLQAILKKSLPKTVVNLPLTKRGHKNNVEMVLDAIGKLYIHSGIRASINNLYPKITFPVSTGTPLISSLCKWNSAEIWDNFNRKIAKMEQSHSEVKYMIDLNDEPWKFLRGNKIDSNVFIPCSLYFKFALSSLETFDKSEKPVTFENIVIHKNQQINEGEILDLRIMVQKGSGNFEVSTDGALLCSGILRKIDPYTQEETVSSNSTDGLNDELETDAIYNELSLRGYQYSGPFRSINKINTKESCGYIFYQEEWNFFLEAMLQMYMFECNTKTTQVPLRIQKVYLDLAGYKKQAELLKAIPVSFDHLFNTVRSCGIELHGTQFKPIKSISNLRTTKSEEIKLTLNFDKAPASQVELAEVVLQLLIENEALGNIEIAEESVAKQKSWQTVFEEITRTQRKFKIISSATKKCEDTAMQVFFDLTTLSKTSNLQDGDFLLAILNSLDENKLFNTMKVLDLGVILHKQVHKNQTALLFRKKRKLTNTLIYEITDNTAQIDEIKEKINSQKVERIIISTRLPSFVKKSEIFQFLSQKDNKRKVRYFEILDSKAPKLILNDQFYQNQLQLDLKYNILTRDRKWGLRINVPIVTKRSSIDNSVVLQTRPGDLESLDWVEQSRDKVQDNRNVKVEYSTINVIDVLRAKRDVDNKTETEMFGLEYSGINAKGNRVMGISGSGTLCSSTSADPEFTWEVPKGWSLEEAATVPLAYATAYMALCLKVEVSKDSSVFIYDGTSAVGQAMINLALNKGAKVFSTYKTEEQKQRLQCQYPTLKHLFCFNDAYEDKILSLTKGFGANIVIYNSCNVKNIQSCISIIKPGACVIVVGELENAFDKSVGMYIFLEEASLHSIIPNNLIHADENTKKKLSNMIKDGLKSNVVKPLASNVYSRDELKKAFTDVSGDVYFGKAVIKVQDSKIGVVPLFSCLNNRTYLIVIDNWNNLFGIKIVEYLIKRGAKEILIASTSKSTSKALYDYHSKMWEESEVKIIFQDGLDLSDSHKVKSLLSEASKLNSIDAIFDLQRMGTSENSSYTKYLITEHLFEESKKVCSNQRKFVVFTMVRDANDDLKSHLFRESNLMSLCKKETNEGLSASLVLWDLIEEIVQLKSTTRETRDFLTISQCEQELDNLMESHCPCAVVSNNENIANSIKSTKKKVEKSDRELFEDYIFNRASEYKGLKTL